MTLCMMAPLSRRKVRANHRPSLRVISLPEKLSERGEGPDVIAENLERGEKRHREEGSSDAPDPEEEGEPDEDRHRIQRQSAAQYGRRHKVRLNKIHDQKHARHEQRV